MAIINGITKQETVITTTNVTVDEIRITGMEADINYNRPQRTSFKIDWEIGYRDTSNNFIQVETSGYEIIGDEATNLLNTATTQTGTLWSEMEKLVITYLQGKNLI